MAHYRSTPDPTNTRMPPGIPYIIGNELAERFSFYGMKGILTIFMTQHLLNAAGQPDYMGDEKAKGWYHLFTGLAYTFPILGAILSDVVLGKYRTILYISLMYCVGHGCLALMDAAPRMGMHMQVWLIIGMIFIAIGAGAIKPCVSAHVGDQFGSGNKRLLTQVFNWFYFSINLGAASSMFLTPILLAGIPIERDPVTNEVLKTFGGPWLAFGLPGVLMAVATFVFWLGRNKFIHVPPAGWQAWKNETFSPEGLRAIRNLAPLFLIFVMMFWAIFDQTGSAWVLQAQGLNRDFLGMVWLESQVQFVNPILILTMIPLFTYVVYPLMGKFFNPTPLRKIGIGFVLTVCAVAISALIDLAIAEKAPGAATAIWAALGQPGQMPASLSDVLRVAREAGWKQEQIQPYIAAAEMPSIGWQFLAYVVLTSAEILVSIVCLEFAYTQSPPKMKSFIMGIFFLGVAFGNYLAMGVNTVLAATKDEYGRTLLEGANYYWFFAALMVLTTIAYFLWAKTYRGQTYIQGEDRLPARAAAEAEAPDAR
jgi:proton-dependent oligopeptide transporter, POT family